MSSVFHLVYVSHAVEDISYTDIRNILEVSRKNNAQENITGLLVFREGFFLQLLEGTEEAVKKVLGNIMMDDRNHSLRVLIEANGERLFGEWSMAYIDGDISSNETEELIEFFEVCLQAGANQRALIMPILRKFRASAPALT
ncbi:Blue light- and temperature-regulated antirepressor YcgF [compost metagenome]